MELLVRLGHFFEQARSDADYATFANELRRHQVSYYIYFVSPKQYEFRNGKRRGGLGKKRPRAAARSG